MTDETESHLNEVMDDIVNNANIIAKHRAQTKKPKNQKLMAHKAEMRDIAKATGANQYGKNTFLQTAEPTEQPEDDTKPPVSQIKDRKNQTDNVKWSIFTEAETKISVVKAAKKAGLKLNEWIDNRLRQAAIDELTKKSQPPAKPEDLVADIVQQFADRMKADQAATAKAQNDLIERQGAQIEQLAAAVANRPATIKEMLFGKAKQG